MVDFAPAQPPFGTLAQPFPEVWTVRGGMRFAPGLAITRNMTIVRQGDELTLVNSVRVPPQTEAQIEKLGKVKHLVRIAAFHGIDDPYYLDRFRPTAWAPPGTTHFGGISHDRELRPGEGPVAGGTVFLFEKGTLPEAVVILPAEGGIAVAGDAYQHWATFEGCSLLGGIMMRMTGFGPAMIGGPWVKRQGAAVREDFRRLLDLPFRHLLPSHGEPLRDTAKEGLRAAVERRF